MSNQEAKNEIHEAQKKIVGLNQDLEQALKALEEKHTTQLSAKDSAYLKLQMNYKKLERAFKKKNKPTNELIRKAVDKTYDRVNAAADRLIDYQVAQTHKWQDKYDALKAEMKESEKIQDGLLTTLDNLILEKDHESAIMENTLLEAQKKVADYEQMKVNYQKMQEQLELADLQLDNRYNLNAMKNEQRNRKI